MSEGTNQKSIIVKSIDVKSFESIVVPQLGKYLIAILSLMPGYFIGVSVLTLWYLAVLYFLFAKRTDLIIEIFVLWSFVSGGAYHYHLLGDSYDQYAYRFFVYFNLFALVLSHLTSTPDKNRELTKLLKFGSVLIVIAVISAISNLVSPVLFGQYFFSSFRWWIFAFVFANTNFKEGRLKSLVCLIFCIVTINSIFGFIQQLFLEIQFPPDGSDLNRLDVASGFMGAYLSQYLTNLCIVFASYFILRFISGFSIYNFFVATLLLLQPFASSSKTALLSGGLFFFISIIIMRFYLKVTILRVSSLLKYGILILIVYFGMQIYKQTNEEYSFSSIGYVFEDYISSKDALQDFGKIQGYYDAISEVAPSGSLGASFGVGPGGFTSPLGLSRKASLVEKYGFDPDEGNEVSSVEARNTDMTEFIGELGYIGALVCLAGLAYLYLEYLKVVRNRKSLEEKLFSLFISQLILLVIFNTVYDRGLTSALFFIPLWTLIVYDFKKETWNTSEIIPPDQADIENF